MSEEQRLTIDTKLPKEVILEQIESVKIDYKTGRISPLDRDRRLKEYETLLEVHYNDAS